RTFRASGSRTIRRAPATGDRSPGGGRGGGRSRPPRRRGSSAGSGRRARGAGDPSRAGGAREGRDRSSRAWSGPCGAGLSRGENPGAGERGGGRAGEERGPALAVGDAVEEQPPPVGRGEQGGQRVEDVDPLAGAEADDPPADAVVPVGVELHL